MPQSTLVPSSVCCKSASTGESGWSLLYIYNIYNVHINNDIVKFVRSNLKVVIAQYYNTVN